MLVYELSLRAGFPGVFSVVGRNSEMKFLMRAIHSVVLSTMMPLEDEVGHIYAAHNRLGAVGEYGEQMTKESGRYTDRDRRCS